MSNKIEPLITQQSIKKETQKEISFIKADTETRFISKRFKVPIRIIGITTDNSGNIFVTGGNAGVWMLSEKSHPRLLVQRGDANGIVWNPLDNCLYVCETSENRISQYSLDTGKHCCFAGTGRPGKQDGKLREAGFSDPVQIAVDMHGDLYVADSTQIKKIELQRGVVKTLSVCHNTARGIAVSKDGSTIYVSDTQGIHKFDGLGRTILLFGKKYNDESQNSLSYPYGIALDEGNLFVSDKVVRKVELKTRKISNFEGQNFLPGIARDANGIIYLGTKETPFWVVGLQNIWKVERFLWIGNMKEDEKNCCLARLPKDIVRVIASYLYCTRINSSLDVLQPSTVESIW